MNVFIDTEFTSLSDPRLLSIGAVADETEYFYGVLDDVPRSVCSPFVRDFVLPLLDARPPDARGSHHVVARAFAAWLAPPDAEGGHVLFMEDLCDVEMLDSLSNGTEWWDKGVCEIRILSLANGTREATAFRDWFAADSGRHRHNALDDAFAYRHAIILAQGDSANSGEEITF